jgi:hypothetical protein
MSAVLFFLACVVGVVVLVAVVLPLMLRADDRRAAVQRDAAAVLPTAVALRLNEAWIHAAGRAERAGVLARMDRPVAPVEELVNADAFQVAVERKTLLWSLQGVYGAEEFPESRLRADAVDPELSLVQMVELEKFRHSMDTVPAV